MRQRFGWNSDAVIIMVQNDKQAEEERLQLPAEFVGQFETRNDTDSFRFTAKARQKYSLEVFGQRNGSNADPVLLVEQVTKDKEGKETFKKIGIHTIGDLARQDFKQFVQQYGKAGEHAWHLANGIDPRAVSADDTVKSVSNEHTFDQDETRTKRTLDILMYLSEKVSRRLRKKGLQGKTVTLKIRFADFRTYTRAETLERPTNFVEDIYACTAKQLKKFQVAHSPVRLLGVRVSNLCKEERQPTLFTNRAGPDEKKERLHRAMDIIKDKFGEKAIKHR